MTARESGDSSRFCQVTNHEIYTSLSHRSTILSFFGCIKIVVGLMTLKRRFSWNLHRIFKIDSRSFKIGQMMIIMGALALFTFNL